MSMKLFNIEPRFLLPYAISAFSEVYGQEYYDIIYKKINNALILLYYDILGMSNYLWYFRLYKERKYMVKFLNEIGYSYQYDNYSERFSDEISDILSYYLDIRYAFGKYTDKSSPIRAFANRKNKTESKIKLINYLLPGDHEKITSSSYDDFINTDEYLKLLEKVDEYNNIYDRLIIEFNDELKEILPHKEYLKQEELRKKKILKKKKEELFQLIYSKLPILVKEEIKNKSLNEQIMLVFGKYGIDCKTYLEEFNGEIDNCSLYDQRSLLKNMEIDIPSYIIDECKEGNYTNYLLFLDKENVKGFVPSRELANIVEEKRLEKYEEGMYEYYMTNEYILNAIKYMNCTKEALENLYNLVKKKIVCILGDASYNGSELFSVMFFTIRPNDMGCLAFTFLHELGHIIDQNYRGIAFETYEELHDINKRNPYDPKYRKYEKFSEAINDIFTLEAIDILQKEGIYLIEPKEFLSLHLHNKNTGYLTKKALAPLISKFRKQVIKAKMNTDIPELTNYIGYNNYEELIDTINKIDYLERNGLQENLEYLENEDLVKEYYEQITRINEIYKNIDIYYNGIKIKKKSYN